MKTIEEKAKQIFDVHAIRADFPILSTMVNGKPLVYFDNGATSQKPKLVIDSIVNYYSNTNSNIHRGVHHLSQLATDAYEVARSKVCHFINAKSSSEIVFTKGATEAINLVAQTWGRNYLKPGDEIVVTAMEHHANIVPWQMVCEQTGAVLKVIPMDLNGELILEEAEKIIGLRTRMLAMMHVSNALGTINPVEKIMEIARKVGALILLDGAQAVPHFKVDVQALDCDFYVFSAHKMFGPSGVGILFGKERMLAEIPPYQGGGDMIKTVTFEKTTYNEAPFKFEAGTPNIEGGIALGAAVDYINAMNHEEVLNYENSLLHYGTEALLNIDGVRIIGQAAQKVPVISFNIDGLHPYDVGFILDKQGIAVRTGHHCAQPVMDFFKVSGTIRASFAFYNTIEEIDSMIAAIHLAKKMLK
jgi:cysteine desulfurase/selenocysteine lyase